MKKILSLVLVIFCCSLFFVGCNGSKQDVNCLSFVKVVSILSPENVSIENEFNNQDETIQELKQIYGYKLEEYKFQYYPVENVIKRTTSTGSNLFDSTYYVFGSNIYTASVNNDGEVVYDFAGYFSDGISEGTIDNGNPVRCMTIIKHTVGINSNYKITYEFKNI